MKSHFYIAVVLACLSVVNKAIAWTLISTPLPPYTIEDRENPGIAIEVFKLISEQLEQKADVDIIPWARAQRVATEGRSVFIAPLTRTPNREKLYEWLIPFNTYQLKLVTNQPGLDINDDKIVNKLKVCALRSSPAHWELIKQAFSHKILFNDETKCMHMLGLKRLDAVLVHGIDSARWGYDSYGFDPSELIYSSSYGEGTLYLASTVGLLTESEITDFRHTFYMLKRQGKISKIFKKYRFKNFKTGILKQHD